MEGLGYVPAQRHMGSAPGGRDLNNCQKIIWKGKLHIAMKHSGKKAKVSGIFLLGFLLLGIGFYTFSQTMQLPLSALSAEKVLSARDILNVSQSFFSWEFAPLELPFYLICVKIFGVSTISSIMALSVMVLLLFAGGLVILYANGYLKPKNVLMWTAIAGLPDTIWLGVVQYIPTFIFCLLFFLFFLSGWIRRHRMKYAAGALVSSVLTVFSFNIPAGLNKNTSAVHETLRAIQKVFRADFSAQKLFQYATVRYFLMTLFILFLVCILVKNIYRLAAGIRVQPVELVFSVAVLLTIFFCCLPFTGGGNEKMLWCAWLPYGSAILLISFCENSGLDQLRFAENRVSFSVIQVIFFVLLTLFGFSPVVRSRPAGTADQVIIFLNARSLKKGYCDPEERAVFLVAGKEQINFLDDENDSENEFIIRNIDEPLYSEKSESHEIGTYRIEIFR